jgi:16S rRNA (guanine966-N2)-methyltransferase
MNGLLVLQASQSSCYRKAGLDIWPAIPLALENACGMEIIMRVIAGKAKSLPLKTLEGLDTRPTTDKIKETLFNILQTDIYGCRFLDLYSGSGAIGIEALSRGAKEAVLVENNKAACAYIKQNLKFTHLEEDAIVMEQDVLSAINRLTGHEVFDIVYMDPPYNNDFERDVLAALNNSGIIDKYTIIIIEESLEADMSYIEDLGYTVYKTKNYKTNKHLFLNLNE